MATAKGGYMSDAYNTNTLTQAERCGCGAGLSGFQVKVVRADTGELLTRFCRRCAIDLVGLPVGRADPDVEADDHRYGQIGHGGFRHDDAKRNADGNFP